MDRRDQGGERDLVDGGGGDTPTSDLPTSDAPDATPDTPTADTPTPDVVEDTPLLDLPPGALTIFDIQDESSPNHPACSVSDANGCTAPDPVTVAGVITAIDSYQRGTDATTYGSFWIQDPIGGPYSGIKVYNLGGTAIDITGLSIGETVQVTGTYAEFFDLTEIQNPTLVVLDPTPHPLAPVTVNPADVATGAAQAEAYEGVLVQVADVTVTDSAVGHGQFQVTGGLLIDDELYNPTPFPGDGTQYNRITGVLTYDFSAVELDPRSADDIDRVANEQSLSIYAIQDVTNADHPDCSVSVPVVSGCSAPNPVTLTGVITAIDNRQEGSTSSSLGSIWIEERDGGPYSGVQVFNPGGTDIPTTDLQIGQTLQVIGTYEEAFDNTEIVHATGQVVDDTVAPVDPAVVSSADVADGGSMAEAYEGVLITVENVTVTNANPDAPGGDHGAAVVTGGLYLDDDLLDWGGSRPAMDATYTSITGILTYSFSHFRLLPRSLDDLVLSE